MDLIVESFRAEWQQFLQLVPRLLTALVVLAIFVLFGRLTAKAMGRFSHRVRVSRTHEVFFRRLIVWLFVLIGLIVSLNLLGLERLAASLVAGGGISAVVLGFAFRGIGENLLAGFFLAFSRPFDVGDLIQSGEFKGQVREILLRYTHVRASDGRDVFIPSAQIFNGPLVNFTRDGLQRLSFAVGIDYAFDTREARRIMLQQLIETPRILREPEPAVWAIELSAQFIQLEASFWVDTSDPKTRMGAIRSEAMERSRQQLRAAGFALSSDVTSNLSVSLDAPVQVALGGSPE